jgi:DNA mismatch repair protein MutS
MTIITEYLSITQKYILEYGPKTLLLMQVGSFFECYALLNEEKQIYEGSAIQDFSDINDLVISKKHIYHDNKPVVMAGFGVLYIEKYIRRMQENNYTIIVYTQDANVKNTTRSLSCIYSPGTYFSNDNNILSNITVCIWIHYSNSSKFQKESVNIALSSIDIYTGFSNTFEYSIEYVSGINNTLFDEIENFLDCNIPSECIIIWNKEFKYLYELISCKLHLFNYETDWVKNILKQKYQKEILITFFPNNHENLFNEWNISSQCYCFLIQFIYKHNPNLIKKLKEPKFENIKSKLVLANHSLKQLNIISDNRYTGKNMSIQSLLNNCVTNMGKRAFNYLLLNPSIDFEYLKKEYDIIDYCYETNFCEEVRKYLFQIKDISKIYRKNLLGKLSPKDYYLIYTSFYNLISLHEFISSDNKISNHINHLGIIFDINEIIEYLQINLNLDNCKLFEDISFDKIYNSIDNIYLFSDSYNTELFTIFNYYKNACNTLEIIKNDINYLIYKLNENNYLNKNKNNENLDDFKNSIKIYECSKMEPCLISTTKKLNLLKKITLDDFNNLNFKFTDQNIKFEDFEIKSHNGNNSMITNSYITSITKSIVKLKEKFINSLQFNFKSFTENFNNKFYKKIDYIIDFISKTDILQNKCFIVDKFNLSKPNIINSENSYISCKGLRHILIEKLNTNELYVTNDIEFNNSGYLLYGTNAVGKTSFIKSIGIAIIMVQAGLFAPAEYFSFSIYKSIFTRIIGNDNIFKGLSTFAVEMSELRSILKYSNKNSLVLGDELCSGTESTSALSIFASGINFLHSINASFIFATHFHEIIKYEEITNLNNLKFIHLSVIYDNISKKLIYDRKIKEGQGDNTYGLEVCKSLNLPDDFLEYAHKLRIKYNNKYSPILDFSSSTYNSNKIKGMCQICNINMGTEVHHLIYQKNAPKHLKNHKANLINICESCHLQIHNSNKQLKIYKTTNGYEIK